MNFPITHNCCILVEINRIINLFFVKKHTIMIARAKEKDKTLGCFLDFFGAVSSLGGVKNARHTTHTQRRP